MIRLWFVSKIVLIIKNRSFKELVLVLKRINIMVHDVLMVGVGMWTGNCKSVHTKSTFDKISHGKLNHKIINLYHI